MFYIGFSHSWRVFPVSNDVILYCRDEDMQSLASLMSMKQADIGNLDDFEEENEEDEENRVNQEEKAAKITGLSSSFGYFSIS